MNITLDLWDLAAIFGGIAAVLGLWMVHAGLGVAAVGVLLVLVGLLGSRQWAFSRGSGAVVPVQEPEAPSTTHSSI